jgi:hypothetical protein
MDLRSYFDDLHKEEAAFTREFPNGVVYVTSLFHRERNSTPGRTHSANWRNAARVVADGTHRRATQDEIDSFLAHQEEELAKNSVAEQKNKRQYIVVVDGDKKPASAVVEEGKSVRTAPFGPPTAASAGQASAAKS